MPPEQRACPNCGGERKCIEHEVTEVIDLIPAEVVVRRDIREKLACVPCEGELVRAPLGNKAVAGGRMGTTLVAQVLVEKYYDGLPLSRQMERYARLGLELAISTLADQVEWATDALEPLWRAVMEQVLSSTVMHLDATSLPVLDRQAARGIRLGTIWGYVGANVTDAGTEHTALCVYTSTGKAVGQRRGELGPSDMLARRVERPAVRGDGQHSQRRWLFVAGDGQGDVSVEAVGLALSHPIEVASGDRTKRELSRVVRNNDPIAGRDASSRGDEMRLKNRGRSHLGVVEEPVSPLQLGGRSADGGEASPTAHSWSPSGRFRGDA